MALVALSEPHYLRHLSFLARCFTPFRNFDSASRMLLFPLPIKEKHFPFLTSFGLITPLLPGHPMPCVRSPAPATMQKLVMQ